MDLDSNTKSSLAHSDELITSLQMYITHNYTSLDDKAQF